MAELCEVCEVSEGGVSYEWSESSGSEEELSSAVTENPSENDNPSDIHNPSQNEKPNEDQDVAVESEGEPAMATSSSYSGGHHRDGHHRYRRSRGHSSGSRSHGSGHSRRHRLATSTITMPSGASQTITNPARPSGWKCGQKSTLITLSPTGKMGQVEYNIVATEMQTTNLGSAFTISKIEKIVNPCLWKRYIECRERIIQENGSANERMLWHGSPAIQVLVDSGLDERYASQYGCWGAGLYFASYSSKSHSYTRGAGKILLCRVIMGKTMQYTTCLALPHPPPGYNSVLGAIPQPEFIVYRREQVYPEYLITYT